MKLKKIYYTRQYYKTSRDGGGGHVGFGVDGVQYLLLVSSLKGI